MFVFDMNDQSMVNVEYVSQICGVCKKTVWRWIQRGDLQATMYSHTKGYEIPVWNLKIFLSTHSRYRKAAARYALHAVVKEASDE